jgi:hypothetical protein
MDERECEVAALEFKSDAPLDYREAKKKFARDVTSLGKDSAFDGLLGWLR